MSWRDRIADLVLYSPSGQEFRPAWKGDGRKLEKSLGVFKYPKIPGAAVQDLDVEAMRLPITLYFEGPDHDIESERFYRACKERGTWEVSHPTFGIMTLQLMSLSEESSPTESANVTVVSTEWIEPMDERFTDSAPQLAAQINEAVDDSVEDATDNLADNAETATVAKLSKFRSALEKAQRVMRTVAATNTAIMNLHGAITRSITGATINIASVAGQFHTLVNLPMESVTSIARRFDYFGEVIDNAFKDFKKDTKNELAVLEFVTTLALAGMAKSVADAGDIASREEAIGLIDTLFDTATRVTDGLDVGQTAFSTQPIAAQYFNRTNLTNLVNLSAMLLLRRSFDLAAAKRITLDRDRAPVEIALTEDVDLDLFISSNRLTGTDIMLLPAGHEVVVYL